MLGRVFELTVSKIDGAGFTNSQKRQGSHVIKDENETMTSQIPPGGREIGYTTVKKKKKKAGICFCSFCTCSLGPGL